MVAMFGCFQEDPKLVAKDELNFYINAGNIYC